MKKPPVRTSRSLRALLIGLGIMGLSQGACLQQIKDQRRKISDVSNGQPTIKAPCYHLKTSVVRATTEGIFTDHQQIGQLAIHFNQSNPLSPANELQFTHLARKYKVNVDLNQIKSWIAKKDKRNPLCVVRLIINNQLKTLEKMRAEHEAKLKEPGVRKNQRKYLHHDYEKENATKKIRAISSYLVDITHNINVYTIQLLSRPDRD